MASETPHDPQPVLEVFKEAVERTDVPWPTAIVLQAEAAAPDPQGWYGLRPPQPKMVRALEMCKNAAKRTDVPWSTAAAMLLTHTGFTSSLFPVLML